MSWHPPSQLNLGNWKVGVGSLGKEGSGEKSTQRKRTRTKRGTDFIGACRCAAITGALRRQAQSLYREPASSPSLEALRGRSEVLVSQNPIVPAARPIRSQSTGIVRELAQAFRGNGSRSQRASSTASHRQFASSHMPRRHQIRRHARAVAQCLVGIGGWVYVHVPLFAVLCLGSRAGSHPHCLVPLRSLCQ